MRKSIFQMLGLVALASMPASQIRTRSDAEVIADVKKPVIKTPFKGCSIYYFNRDGMVSNYRTPFTVFSCQDLKPENAIKKFNTWKEKHPEV